MGVQVTLRDIQAAFNSAAAQNANYDDIEQAFNSTLDRTGSVDNAMEVDLDMGLNTIINLGDSRGQGNAVMSRSEIEEYVKGIVGSATVPTDGNSIIVEEFGQFYRQISGSTEGQTVYPLEFAYTPNSFTMSVYVNGVLQVQDLDYEETNSLTVTMLSPMTVNDTLQFVWSKTITAVPTNVYLTKTVKVFENVMGQDTFPINYNPGNLDVYMNGVKLQRQEDYIADNGTTVILTSPTLTATDVVECIAFSDFTIANHYTKEEVYAKDETYSQLETYSQTEVYTKAEVDALLSGSVVAVPVGTILANSSSTVDTGYLECNGSQVSRDTYSDLFAKIGTTYGVGNGLTTFSLPDLRGEFLRGFDNGRGADTSRAMGSSQAGEIQSHDHTGSSTVIPTASDVNGVVPNNNTLPLSVGVVADPITRNFSNSIAAAGGVETRPRNVAVMFQIKY